MTSSMNHILDNSWLNIPIYDFAMVVCPEMELKAIWALGSLAQASVHLARLDRGTENSTYSVVYIMLNAARATFTLVARRTGRKGWRKNHTEATIPPERQSKVALVTGGSRGIGKAICRALLQDGYCVAVVSKSNLCEITANELSEAAGRPGAAKGVRCDLAQLSSIHEALVATESLLGPVDVLVNNAGISVDSLIVRMREEDLQEVITTNLMAPLVFAREVSKSFLKRKVSEGNIIMIGSIIADQGNVGQTVYAASKAGLSGAVKSLALELGSRNIRTNLISPGYIKTDMTASIKSLEGRPEVLPEEVAEAVRFVLRTKSLNGESITVDGVTPFQDTIRSSLQKL